MFKEIHMMVMLVFNSELSDRLVFLNTLQLRRSIGETSQTNSFHSIDETTCP